MLKQRSIPNPPDSYLQNSTSWVTGGVLPLCVAASMRQELVPLTAEYQLPSTIRFPIALPGYIAYNDRQ